MLAIGSIWASAIVQQRRLLSEFVRIVLWLSAVAGVIDIARFVLSVLLVNKFSSAYNLAAIVYICTFAELAILAVHALCYICTLVAVKLPQTPAKFGLYPLIVVLICGSCFRT